MSPGHAPAATPRSCTSCAWPCAASRRRSDCSSTSCPPGSSTPARRPKECCVRWAPPATSTCSSWNYVNTASACRRPSARRRRRLEARLEAERARARTLMLGMLDSEATRHWLEVLNLASADFSSPAAPQAPRAATVMPERVRARFRKLRKAVRKLDTHSSMDAYHLVRRRAKQLRYSIECGADPVRQARRKHAAGAAAPAGRPRRTAGRAHGQEPPRSAGSGGQPCRRKPCFSWGVSRSTTLPRRVRYARP